MRGKTREGEIRDNTAALGISVSKEVVEREK